jgi:soluble lytic murein transglycosylase-like protein
MCIFFASLALAQTPPPPAPPPPAPPPETPARVPSAAELMRASVDKQRAAMAAQQDAVRKQAQGAGATLVPWSPPPAPADAAAEPACDPIGADIVTPFVENAAKANHLEVKLVNAVIERESAFRPCAVSSKGAQGLMQLMPETASELSVKDVFDPKENIAAGAKYLKELLDKYKGDTKLALAAYNAGPAAVDAIGAIPDIQETRDYVDAIIKKIK